MFKIILCLSIMTFKECISQSQQCPNRCSCSPSIAATGLVVSCGPGLTSFPANVPTNTKIFSIGVGQSSSISQTNSITTLTQTNFIAFPGVVIVHIEFSDVQSITPGTFSTLSSLVKLNLKGNKIKFLTRSMLTGLSRLEHLILTDNTDCKLDHDVFADLRSLKSLDLGGLNLNSLDTILSNLNSLEHLDIHGNNLVQLEYSSFMNVNSLKFLDVSFNDLYSVQRGMMNVLPTLKHFDLTYNPWRCNCAISWLKTLPSRFVAPVRGNGGGLICQQPSNLLFKDLISIPDNVLACIPAQIKSCSVYHVTVLVGQAVNITCQIKGDPYPDVTWQRPDGKNISTILMTATNDIVNFSIPASVYTKHNGQWSVIAENYNGSDTKTIDITIVTTTVPSVQTTPASTKTTLTTKAVTAVTIPTTATKLHSASPVTLPSQHSYPSTVANTVSMPSPNSKNSLPPQSNPTPSSSIDTMYVIIIVAASVSCGVFITGTGIFIVIVHKSKRKVRIAAKRRSVYSKQEDDFEMSHSRADIPTPLQEINVINFKD